MGSMMIIFEIGKWSIGFIVLSFLLGILLNIFISYKNCED